MNPFFTTKTNRLKEWRELRKSITSDMTDSEQLNTVVQWWAQCPISKMVIDPYGPDTWPLIWELIYHGEFCESAIALGMEQTLLQREGRWTNKRVKLLLIKDDIIGIYLTVLVDNKWILNYSHGEIFDISNIDNVEIIDQFIFNGQKHVKNE